MEFVEKALAGRDVNDETSEAITHWACTTREILARLEEGKDLQTGQLLAPNVSVGCMYDGMHSKVHHTPYCPAGEGVGGGGC